MTGIEIAFLAIGLFLFAAAITYFAISLYRDRKTYQLIQAIDRNADAKTIKQLLNRGARVNPSPSLIQRLLKRLANAAVDERTPLRQSSPERKVEPSASVSNNGAATPSHPEMVVKDLLTFAIQKKATQAATVLIEHGASVNPKTKTRDTQILPLSQFFQFLYKPDETTWHALGELLLAKGADVNGNIGFLSPLLFAARNKFPIEWIQKLIDKGAFVNPFYPDKAHAFPKGVSFPEVTETQPFAYGPSPLMWAVLHAETDFDYGVALWKLLIKQPGIYLHSIPAGTDFSTDYKEKQAPLTLAVDKKMADALEQFLTTDARPIYTRKDIDLAPSHEGKNYPKIDCEHYMFRDFDDELAILKIWDLMLAHSQNQKAGLIRFGSRPLSSTLLHMVVGHAELKYVELILKYVDAEERAMLTALSNGYFLGDARGLFYADAAYTENPAVTAYELALFLSKEEHYNGRRSELRPTYEAILKLIQEKMAALNIPLTRSEPQTYYMKTRIRGRHITIAVSSLDAEAYLKALSAPPLPETDLPADEAKKIEVFVRDKKLNAYQLLGLAEPVNEIDALSDKVIKSAHASYVRKHHFDKNTNNPNPPPFDGDDANLARDILRDRKKLKYHNKLCL